MYSSRNQLIANILVKSLSPAVETTLQPILQLLPYLQLQKPTYSQYLITSSKIFSYLLISSCSNHLTVNILSPALETTLPPILQYFLIPSCRNQLTATILVPSLSPTVGTNLQSIFQLPPYIQLQKPPFSQYLVTSLIIAVETSLQPIFQLPPYLHQLKLHYRQYLITCLSPAVKITLQPKFWLPPYLQLQKPPYRLLPTYVKLNILVTSLYPAVETTLL